MNPSLEDVNIVQADKVKRQGQQLYKPQIKRAPKRKVIQNLHK